MKTYDAIIIGSGAAGLNAADCLFEQGLTNIAIITEGLYASTSINTGSDKQTYYKLSTTDDEKDSVLDMAKTYYSCGGIEGYHALTESALSLRCFFKLVEAGVPFPMNEYGEYVGYRTDHDARKRASSCGPLTSKYMCEALIRRIKQKNIEIIEGKRAVRLISDGKKVGGCVTIDIADGQFTVFKAKNTILACGGSAGIYSKSVYPECHTGGIGIAIREGASCTSLSEWQYGIASTDFRWNLSGSYQQVIPRYVSMDGDGNLREFLTDYTDNQSELIFEKGYNWPFSPKNLGGKSSVLDIAVYTETAVKGNRVFLDYRRNPSDYDFEKLSDEAKDYIRNSGLEEIQTPVERLHKLNEKAYKLYLDHGIELEKVPLAADICAQHCNGGLTVDKNYKTTLDNLYACGECAGVFGVARPGGTALNSTQVSSLMASLDIKKRLSEEWDFDGFDEKCRKALSELEEKKSALSETGALPLEVREGFAGEMSKVGAFLRCEKDIADFSDKAKKLYGRLFEATSAESSLDIYRSFVNEDLLLTLIAVLESERVYSSSGLVSRGGYLIYDGENLQSFTKSVLLEDDLQSVVDVKLEGGNFSGRVRKVSPIPQSEQWFERVAFGEQK